MPILIPNIGAGKDKISQKTDIMIIWLSFEMMYYKSWIGSGTIFLTWSDSNYCFHREVFWKRRRKKVQLSFSVCQTFRNLNLAQGFQNPFMDVTKHCSFLSVLFLLLWPCFGQRNSFTPHHDYQKDDTFFWDFFDTFLPYFTSPIST